jgi:low temperature requirement protein LtrA
VSEQYLEREQRVTPLELFFDLVFVTQVTTVLSDDPTWGVTTSFWLAYFDFFPIRGRQMLADRSGAQRTALARDAYTYLHLPMVAGIVPFTFAMKTTLAHVGDELDTSRRLPSAAAPRSTSSPM